MGSANDHIFGLLLDYLDAKHVTGKACCFSSASCYERTCAGLSGTGGRALHQVAMKRHQMPPIGLNHPASFASSPDLRTDSEASAMSIKSRAFLRRLGSHQSLWSSRLSSSRSMITLTIVSIAYPGSWSRLTSLLGPTWRINRLVTVAQAQWSRVDDPDNLKPLWAGWSDAPLSVHGESASVRQKLGADEEGMNVGLSYRNESLKL